MNNEPDLMVEGFERLDSHLFAGRTPKIRWGEIYKSWTDAKKVEYLEKFAASMNEAAARVQSERNKLGKLCELKEKQLESMNKAVADNNAMLQQEVTRMNEQKQYYNAELARLNQKIRELESEA